MPVHAHLSWAQLGKRIVVEQGYAVSDEDVTPGIASLGAPIFDYTNGVRAALSVGGMKSLILGEDRLVVEAAIASGASLASACTSSRMTRNITS